MGKVIGRLPVVYDPAARRVQVESSAEFVETQLLQRLDDLAHGQPLRLTLAVEPERKGRSKTVSCGRCSPSWLMPTTPGAPAA